jgi:hypothetical protein
MKPTEFIVENSVIAQEADDMHRDHEVQMARSQLYSTAQAAIEIHKLLKNVSEMEGLEGWVQTKIAIASEYLESVRDYLKYEQVSQDQEMMPFAESAADYALDQMLNETASAGASGAGGIATSMAGPAGKPSTGKPKKIANAHKAKKIAVGKGVY